MNSVQSLLDMPFSSRSSVDKLETKRLGRPTPDLDLRQRITSRQRTFNRTFNSELYNKYLWMCGCDVKNALFCFPCLLFGREELWTNTGVTDLNHLCELTKKHMASPSHMKNVVQFSLFGTVNIAAQLDGAYRRHIELHNEKVKHNRYILNLIINCVRFCGAFELASRGHDESTSSSNPGVFGGLINFSAELDAALKSHLEKATVFKGASKTIQTEILQTMFGVCQEEISKEIAKAEYLSIIAEETSDVSDISQIAVVFRYIANGKPVERFWDFLTPSDHKPNALSTAILAELDKHIKDDKNKLIAQTYDGAAVMVVQSIVRQTYEQAAYVHCYAHQLDLVMLNAASAKTNVRIFFANLQGISKFFSNSPQRTLLLDEVVKTRLPSADIKWDFNSKVVCTVFEHREDIIETMRQILSEIKNANTINQASGYIKILTSESFILWLNLFYKIMPHVEELFENFQTKEIDPVTADNYISSFESCLSEIRNSLPKLTNNNETSKRRKTDYDYSNRYAKEAKDVCEIITFQANYRFRFTGHLSAASLFFSEKYSQYSKTFPENNFQQTCKVYRQFLNGPKLRIELTIIYETEEFRSISGLLTFYDYISRNRELSETLSETLQLLQILITIPMASTEPERCFSTMKRIKTFLTNTMSQEGLAALAMLSKERDLIESIPDFNQRVIDKFANAPHRSVDFLFQ